MRTETAAAAVSDDEDFLVFWSNGPLYASRVSASSEVQVPPVQIRVGTPQNISACWSGSAYLVTWTDWIVQGVMLASLSRDGKPLTAPHLILPQARTFAGALTSNGENALLAYATGNGSATRAARSIEMSAGQNSLS
jgi:hypothetical protein